MTNRTDNFNRANNVTSLGTPSDSGSAWVVDSVSGVGGVWGINTNRAYTSTVNGNTAATLESSEADGTVQVTLYYDIASPGLVFRSDAAGNLWMLRGSGNLWLLDKFVAGVPTTIATSTAIYPKVDGDVLSAVLSGTSIICKINGVAITNLSITDATYQTQTKHGLGYQSGTTAMRWEDYSFTGSAPAATKLGIRDHALGSSHGLATSNVPFDFQPVLLIQDASSATVTGDNTTVVTAAITSGAGTLIGTVTKTAVAGVVDFGQNFIAGVGAWVTATGYLVNDRVLSNGSYYLCTTAHTSGATTEPTPGSLHDGGIWQIYWTPIAYTCNFLGVRGIGSNTITYSAAGLTSAVETAIFTGFGSYDNTVAGVGVVTCASPGAAVFTTSQANAAVAGSNIIVSGTAYQLTVFDGAFTGTLAGAPTFVASTFAIASPAELPRATPDTTALTITGTTYLETAATIQSRINTIQAAGGNLNHKVRIQDGQTITTQITVPLRAGGGTGWLQIESQTLPCLAGNRCAPADFTTQATWEVSGSSNQPIISLDAYPLCKVRLVGLHIKQAATSAPSGGVIEALVRIGHSDIGTTLAEVPTGFAMERCYVHGLPSSGKIAHAVGLFGADCAVFDNYFANLAEWVGGQETQVFFLLNSGGPFLIENNYLESMGEQILVGGAYPGIYQVIPGDLTIRRNHFNAPRSFQGTATQHKNLTEFKLGRRILIDGNIYENCWVGAQDGTALNISAYGTVGKEWCGTSDITFRNNFIRNAEAVLSISSNAGIASCLKSARITFRNNATPNISNETNPALIGAQRMFLITGADIQITHNTMLAGINPTRIATLDAASTAPRLVFRDNIVSATYGLPGGAASHGNAVASVSPGNAVWDHNVMIDYYLSDPTAQATFAANGYTPNWFPATNALLGLANPSITATWGTADPDLICAALTLLAASLYKRGNARQSSDAKDVGCDLTALRVAITGVMTGTTTTTTASTSRSRAARQDETGFGVFTNANRWR